MLACDRSGHDYSQLSAEERMIQIGGTYLQLPESNAFAPLMPGGAPAATGPNPAAGRARPMMRVITLCIFSLLTRSSGLVLYSLSFLIWFRMVSMGRMKVTPPVPTG